MLTKKIIMDMSTGLFYGGTYSGEIHWVECVLDATYIEHEHLDSNFYDWEVDELSTMSLEIKEIIF